VKEEKRMHKRRTSSYQRRKLQGSNFGQAFLAKKVQGGKPGISESTSIIVERETKGRKEGGTYIQKKGEALGSIISCLWNSKHLIVPRAIKQVDKEETQWVPSS